MQTNNWLSSLSIKFRKRTEQNKKKKKNKQKNQGILIKNFNVNYENQL